MVCMCDKLRRDDFAALTNSERKLLNRLFSKAPQLFSPQPRGSRKKHPRQGNGKIQPYHSQKVEELESTYPCLDTQQALEWRGVESRLQDLASQTDIYIRIFLAVERSDQVVALNQLSKRIYCYALTLVHPKNASIEPIIERIKHTVNNVQNISQKIYNMLWIGRQWSKIAKMLGAITSNDWAANPIIGVLCLLGSGSTWERASDEARELALRRLCKNTDLQIQSISYDGLVENVVSRILDRQQPPQFGLPPHSLRSTNSLQLTNHVLMLAPNSFGQARQTSTWAKTELLAASDAAVAEAAPVAAEDKLLLILLSFLSDSPVSPNMLFQAVGPHRRWATNGEIETSESEWVLGHLLPNNITIRAALERLMHTSLVSTASDDGYLLNNATRMAILRTLPSKLQSFWRQQALYVACATIPWKYLHSPNFPLRETIKPHIIHTLNAVRDCDGYRSVPLSHMPGLVSALVEASRFSGLHWKRMMIAEARRILDHSADDYLELLIAQREVLVGRLSREPITITPLEKDFHNDNRRIHAAAGSAIIQEALNDFQNEKLSSAMNTMNRWNPSENPPSVLEGIIDFRMNLLRGKILRFQGNFEDSIQKLELSRDFMEAHQELYFQEDIGDLVSELADTFQEMGDLSRGEALLKMHLAQDHTAATRRILLLSFAECLFSQQKFAEAKSVCDDLKDCGATISKMARLRLYITTAKLYHIQSDLDKAFAWWTEALQLINKFPPTSGNATRVIYLSLCDILSRQGQKDLEQTTRTELAKLHTLSSNAEAKYWITGLRRWYEYITSISSSRLG